MSSFRRLRSPKAHGVGARFGILILGVALASLAHARPEFLDTFREVFGPLKGKVATAQCMVCHVKPPVRNAFGKAVREAFIQLRLPGPNAAAFQAVEPIDSDGDGWPNGDEIRAGTLPGDRNSAPDGTPPLDPAPVTPTKEPTRLIPEHAFHPMIVHFPIALFLFGVFLDVLGATRRDGSLRRLAVWNIGIGALSALAAVGTGLTAFFIRGFPFEGIYRVHMLLGIGTAVTMLSVAWFKRKNPEASGWDYWIPVAIATILTILAGHLGATIVFG